MAQMMLERKEPLLCERLNRRGSPLAQRPEDGYVQP